MHYLMILLMVCGLCFGGVNVGMKDIPDGSVIFYFELASDFNDAGVVQATDFNDIDDCVSVDVKGRDIDFSGSLYDIFIDPNGSGEFDVVIKIDPPEPRNITAVAKTYKIADIGVNAADGNDFFYPLSFSDVDSNPYAGPKVMGKVYIGVEGANHASQDNIKVYLYGKKD